MRLNSLNHLKTKVTSGNPVAGAILAVLQRTDTEISCSGIDIGEQKEHTTRLPFM